MAKEEWRTIRWGYWLGLLFLILVLMGLFRAAWWFKDFATSDNSLPIEELTLVGERRFTTNSEVQQALSTMQGASLMTVDIADVSRSLTALPWVERVTVRREWPNRLRVFLVEHIPVARWSEKGWLSESMNSFEAPKHSELIHLPSLAGPDGSERKVWQMWHQIQVLLESSDHSAMRLTLTGRHAWSLELTNGVVLELGRKDVEARLKRFIELWPELGLDGRVPEKIDLRYDMGLAVKWKQESE